MVFHHQRLWRLAKLRMHFNASDGTHNLALRFVVVPHALGACARLNDVDLCAHRDRIIWTLWFAHVAIDALVGNAQRHFS